jgi:hypothetical protein
MRTHGLSSTGAYKSWHAMWARCTNERHVGYRYYGGRGFRPCARWESVENFVADMGHRPEGMSIDRIDNDKGYLCGKCDVCVAANEPCNCRWANAQTQALNSIRPRIIRTPSEQTLRRRALHTQIRARWLWEECGSLYSAYEIQTMCAEALEEAGLSIRECDDPLVADNYSEPPLYEEPAAGMTLAEIGKVFGLTRERVRQIEEMALAKCRRAFTAIEVNTPKRKRQLTRAMLRAARPPRKVA